MASNVFLAIQIVALAKFCSASQTSVHKSPIKRNTSHQEVIYVTFTPNVTVNSTLLSNTGAQPSITTDLPKDFDMQQHVIFLHMHKGFQVVMLLGQIGGTMDIALCLLGWLGRHRIG